MQAEVDRFRTARQKTLSILAAVSDAQTVWSPRKGSWSIAQIADHLLLSEEMYREQFQRLIQKANDGRGTSIDISLKEVDVALAMIPHDVISLFEIPFRIFNQCVPHAVREKIVRYPLIASLNPEVSKPRERLVPERLRRDLASSLLATEDFFRSPMPPDLHRLTINHPILGNNTIPQLFRIVIAHEQRHHEQMAKVRAHAGFPAS